MSKAAAVLALAALLASQTLTACSPPPRDRVDQDKLNASVDRAIGGLGTCVIILDTQSGRKGYQYGRYDVCHQLLPPCETFQAPAAVIGLDAGLVTPATVFKWDHSAQPKAWQVDANMGQAFKSTIQWWFARLSGQIGPARYASALSAYGYGNKDVAGPAASFWMGPANGGSLGISTVGQADFMRRLYAGKLPAKPASQQAVAAAMQSGPGLSEIAGSCSDLSDRSRGVGWWVGRMSSPQRDFVIAASVEASDAPPGSEVGDEMKQALSDAGLMAPAT